MAGQFKSVVSIFHSGYLTYPDVWDPNLTALILMAPSLLFL